MTDGSSGRVGISCMVAQAPGPVNHLLFVVGPRAGHIKALWFLWDGWTARRAPSPDGGYGVRVAGNAAGVGGPRTPRIAPEYISSGSDQSKYVAERARALQNWQLLQRGPMRYDNWPLLQRGPVRCENWQLLRGGQCVTTIGHFYKKGPVRYDNWPLSQRGPVRYNNRPLL